MLDKVHVQVKIFKLSTIQTGRRMLNLGRHYSGSMSVRIYNSILVAVTSLVKLNIHFLTIKHITSEPGLPRGPVVCILQCTNSQKPCTTLENRLHRYRAAKGFESSHIEASTTAQVMIKIKVYLPLHEESLIFGYILLHHLSDTCITYQLSSRNNICSSVYLSKSTLNETG
jgi:hypothetical protein